MYKEDQRLSAVPNLKINKANGFKQLLPIKTDSIFKTHALLHTKYLVLQRKRIRAIFSFLKLSQMHGFL